jgi:DNA invertase Pin-like site-specific DNA recombinase
MQVVAEFRRNNMLNLSNQIFKVGVYIRLSREDGDKQESESIGNQRSILMRYIKENGFIFVDEYVDDGISRNYF